LRDTVERYREKEKYRKQRERKTERQKERKERLKEGQLRKFKYREENNKRNN
jgi:hypothetical protein